MSLTVKQVQEALTGLDASIKIAATEDGRYATRCPVCNIDGALTFSPSPFNDSAVLDCENDHPDQIEGALRVGLGRLRKLADDPIAFVRSELQEPDLQRIIKHGKGGATYELHYGDGTIVELGDVTVLLSQPKFKAAYLPQRRRLPTKHTLKDAQWIRLVEAIERAAEERDTVAGDTEEVRGWLSRYLRSNRAISLDAADGEALYDFLTPDAGPFTDHNGRLHVRLSDFAAWINQVGGGRITVRELSSRLSQLSFDRAQPSARRPQHIHKDAAHPDVRKQRYYASTPWFDAHE